MTSRERDDMVSDMIYDDVLDVDEADQAALKAADENVINEPKYGIINVPEDVLAVIAGAPSGMDILTVCIDLAAFLAGKNASYGDSALNPIGIFSKASPRDQIHNRIDDKLNRLKNGQSYPNDNDVLDIVGYLILLLVLERREHGGL
jgi:hypothetical protein